MSAISNYQVCRIFSGLLRLILRLAADQQHVTCKLFSSQLQVSIQLYAEVIIMSVIKAK
jgi:hypothetical protein